MMDSDLLDALRTLPGAGAFGIYTVLQDAVYARGLYNVALFRLDGRSLHVAWPLVSRTQINTVRLWVEQDQRVNVLF